MATPGPGDMADRPLRVATLGLGFGAAVHVPAFASLPGVDVIALGGRDAKKAATTAAKAGVPNGVSGIEELLALAPDIVTLAVPPRAVEPAAMAALKAGCAVFCEKPLGHDLASARRLEQAGRGRLTAVDFQFAELPAFRRLHALVTEGAAGRLRHVQVTWLVESYALSHGLRTWKVDSDEGGVTALLGTHLLYLAEWLFGPAARVEARFAATAAPEAGTSADDLVELHLVFAGGGTLTASVGNANPGLHRHLWHVVGSKASLALDNPTSDYMRGFTLTGAGALAGERLEDTDDAKGDGRIPAVRSLAKRFVKAVRGQAAQPFVPGFAEGLRVQSLTRDAMTAAL